MMILLSVIHKAQLKVMSIWQDCFRTKFLLAVLILFTGFSYLSAQVDEGWRAGVAKTIITPDEPIWMAGYAARNRPAEGTLHDLRAEALAIEDKNGKKAILITTDLLGFPKQISDNIRSRIKTIYNIDISEIILSSTHTHSGPVLKDALFDIYPLEEAHLKVIYRYSKKLETKIVELAGEALESMIPVNLYSANGVVRFQVNRRKNSAANLHQQTELKGPSDHSVPVIKVTGENGNIVAIVFGYACHTTVLDIYQFSGDYAGFAKIELEKLHPEAITMFFQGAGSDQNPLPRRTIPLAEQYGRELAAAVDRVLKEPMKRLDPVLLTAYSEIDLYFDNLPGIKELGEFKLEAHGYQKNWAARQIEIIQSGKSRIKSYPFPVQMWGVGDQLIMVLGGEPVIEYAIGLKRIFGQEIFVMGYANDVMGYIPTESILKQSDYEAEISQMVYGLPAKWRSGLEKRILDEFIQLSNQMGINPDGN